MKRSTTRKLQVAMNLTWFGAPSRLIRSNLWGCFCRRKFQIWASSCTQSPPPMLLAMGTLCYHLKSSEPPRGEALGSALPRSRSPLKPSTPRMVPCVWLNVSHLGLLSLCVYTRSVPARSRTKRHIYGPVIPTMTYSMTCMNWCQKYNGHSCFIWHSNQGVNGEKWWVQDGLNLSLWRPFLKET